MGRFRALAWASWPVSARGEPRRVRPKLLAAAEPAAPPQQAPPGTTKDAKPGNHGLIGQTVVLSCGTLSFCHCGPEGDWLLALSLIHISEPTRLGMISYAVFCLKKKNTTLATSNIEISTKATDPAPQIHANNT